MINVLQHKQVQMVWIIGHAFQKDENDWMKEVFMYVEVESIKPKSRSKITHEKYYKDLEVSI